MSDESGSEYGRRLVVISLPVVYNVLTRFVFPVRITEIPGGEDVISKELKDIGSMSRPEKMVAVVFIMTALLWVFRPLLSPAPAWRNGSAVH